MQFSLSILLTIAWTLLPSSFEYFNFSNHKITLPFKVVIDAGHGGRDSGCLGAPHNEKEIVLNIAKSLGEKIQNSFSDVEIIYTRDKDIFIPLNIRAKIANDNQADLFISIHCNSLPSAKTIHGSETYVMGLSEARENLEVAKRENAAIYLEKDYKKTYLGYDPNSNEGHILLSMFQNIHLEKSIEFAAMVEESIKIYAHGKSRGVKQAGFLVLRETNMPSVLIETGYLTNTQDNTFLQESTGQESMASAIFEAFKNYKNGVEFNHEIAVKQQVSPSTVLVNNTPLKTENKIVKHQGEKQKVEKISEPMPVRKHSMYEYRIQLAASVNPMSTFTGKWKEVSSSIEVKKEGKYHKYLTRSTPKLSEAKLMLAEMKKKGFSNAFMVAYKNGARVKILH